MANETAERKADTRAADDGGGERLPAAVAGAPVTPARRPYVTPELRCLGRVADVTFTGLGSVTDMGTHTGHNQKV
jgi:hypothetical protein